MQLYEVLSKRAYLGNIISGAHHLIGVLVCRPRSPRTCTSFYFGSSSTGITVKVKQRVPRVLGAFLESFDPFVIVADLMLHRTCPRQRTLKTAQPQLKRVLLTYESIPFCDCYRISNNFGTNLCSELKDPSSSLSPGDRRHPLYLGSAQQGLTLFGFKCRRSGGICLDLSSGRDKKRHPSASIGPTSPKRNLITIAEGRMTPIRT